MKVIIELYIVFMISKCSLRARYIQCLPWIAQINNIMKWCLYCELSHLSNDLKKLIRLLGKFRIHLVSIHPAHINNIAIATPSHAAKGSINGTIKIFKEKRAESLLMFLQFSFWCTVHGKRKLSSIQTIPCVPNWKICWVTKIFIRYIDCVGNGYTDRRIIFSKNLLPELRLQSVTRLNLCYAHEYYTK